jgi:hypothetical protein
MTMQRVIISNYDEYGDPTEGVGISSNSMTPIDVQSRLQTTIQTHNAVNIPLSGNSYGNNTWMDCDGFDKIAITLLNDAVANNDVDVFFSNDGVSIHAQERLTLSAVSTQYRDGITDTKARYFKIRVSNNDATLAHTMSAWAYLKA